MKKCFLTTSDNKFDPFTEFDEWFNYDTNEKRYGTCSLLARFVVTSDELSEDEQTEAISDAVDRIIMLNLPVAPDVHYVKIFTE